jgi:hypothetical protein
MAACVVKGTAINSVKSTVLQGYRRSSHRLAETDVQLEEFCLQDSSEQDQNDKRKSSLHCIPADPASFSGQRSAFLNSVVVFFSPSRQMLRWYLKLRHKFFLSRPSQPVIQSYDVSRSQMIRNCFVFRRWWVRFSDRWKGILMGFSWLPQSLQNYYLKTGHDCFLPVHAIYLLNYSPTHSLTHSLHGAVYYLKS